MLLGGTGRRSHPQHPADAPASRRCIGLVRAGGVGVPLTADAHIERVPDVTAVTAIWGDGEAEVPSDALFLFG